MMKRQVRRFDIDYPLEWHYGVSFEQVKKDIEYLEAAGCTHIDIDTEGDGYGASDYITIKAKIDRLETVEEYKERTDAIKIAKQRQEEREKANYERLKAKYEKGE